MLNLAIDKNISNTTLTCFMTSWSFNKQPH